MTNSATALSGPVSCTVTASINLAALRHNLARVKQLVQNSQVVSVIKANAYGHGVLPVARALTESDYFAVARLEEALLLRAAGISKTVLLLEGVFSEQDYALCVEQNFILVVQSLEQFQCLQTFNKKNASQPALKYWLKLETGMHRLGLSAEEIQILVPQLKNLTDEELPEAMMSHFASADEINNPLNEQQLAFFKHSIDKLSVNTLLLSAKKSMANSAAILSLPEAHFNWVRPGIMLYGVSPFETARPLRTGLDEQLQPVMTLSSQLISVKKLRRGDCVGYGAHWCCPEDMEVGVVAIGYGDGYPRHAVAGTPVLIHGIEVPLVGRVSMDMITIDLRKLTALAIQARIGDPVILWGNGLPIEKISQKADTIAYELLCQLTARVNYKYES